MAKRILLLGASRYYARLVQAAQEIGCEVIAIDRDPAAYGFRFADHAHAVDITDAAGAVAVARRYAVDGVVAVNDFGVRTAAAVAEALGLVGIGHEAAECATNKALMRRRWEAAGVPSARFRTATTVAEAREAVEALGTFPLIVKPADSRGGGSRGVSKIESLADVAAAVEFAQSYYPDRTVIVEEFLEGIEQSVETITFADETHVIAVADKVKTPPPYRVDKSVLYPTLFTGAELERIHAVAKAAVRALGIDVGAAHVEMCSTVDGPRLFEVGARCGGGGTPDPIVPFVTGVEMFKEVVRIAIGERPQRLTPCFSRGCDYRFLTPPAGRLRRVSGIEEVRRWEGILDCEILAQEGEEIRPVRTGGDRAGFLIAGADTRQAAVALADAAERTIQFEYDLPAMKAMPVLV